MLNLNINSKAITDMANQYNSDRYTAMARVAAIEMGITEAEMPHYLQLFHENMAKRWGALQSIHEAICGIILNPHFMAETVAKCVDAKPDPLQSSYNFSLN